MRREIERQHVVGAIDVLGRGSDIAALHAFPVRREAWVRTGGPLLGRHQPSPMSTAGGLVQIQKCVHLFSARGGSYARGLGQ